MEQPFDGRSLHTLRSAVAAHASAAGLGRQQVYDVTAAAHELAANTVRHGPGRGRLLLWIDQAFLYCQVSDDGTGAGPSSQLPADSASWRASPGHGLWLIGQLADELTIDRSPAGVTAFAIAPGRPRSLRRLRGPDGEAAGSADHVEVSQRLGGAQPDDDLAGRAVALSELLGPVGPQVASGDLRRGAEQLGGILGQLGRALYLHEGKGRFFQVHA
jgi:anti-sigma regulatory factor (Ser/Thr protein kinase)